jgi:hypothetical protein
MSTAEAIELAEVLDRVEAWPPAWKITLARRILEGLETREQPAAPRGRPVGEPIGIGAGAGPPPGDEPRTVAPRKGLRGLPAEDVIGLLKTDREPPTDEECKRIMEEERWKKYGP